MVAILLSLIIALSVCLVKVALLVVYLYIEEVRGKNKKCFDSKSHVLQGIYVMILAL
jgi:hypothetical protein